MSKVIKVQPLKLDTENLGEFGQIISTETKDPLAKEEGFSFWYNIALLEKGNSYSVSIVESNPADRMIADSLETHLNTQELLVPLTGSVCILITDSDKDDPRKPDLTTVRAFRLREGEGVILKPGIWHRAPLCKNKKVQTLCIIREDTPQDDLILYSLPEDFGLVYEIDEQGSLDA